MGGNDLGVLYEDLKQKQEQQARLAADLRALNADYPAFRFSIVTGFTGAAIEALPRACYTGELVAVIKPDAEGIREVLDAALTDPDP